MKRLLCVYPGSARDRAAFFGRHRKTLRERGIELVLADDWRSDLDREIFDDYVELPPADEVRAACDELELYASVRSIDGILAQSEAALAPGAWLADRLGLPGVGVQGAFACIHKLVSRERLNAHDVPTPAFALAIDAADVRGFAREHGMPIVLKGCASSLGRLVTRVDSIDAIDAAVASVQAGLRVSRDIRRLVEFAQVARLDARCDPREAFLVEQFFDGAPVETDGLVVDGEVACFGVIDQILTPPPRFYVASYLLPADRPADQCARIESISRTAIAASGLRTSGFSIELRERAGDVRVIEVNARLGEDEGFPELFRRAIGFEPLWRAIEIALGERPSLTIERREHWALAYACSFVAGRVTEVSAESELAALRAQGIEVAIEARVGDVWHAAPHPDAFPHVAWALASDSTSSRTANERARAAASRLRVEIAPAR